MADECGCGCAAAPLVILPCSGSADVGALADQGARQLARDDVGKMSCLAGVGGRVPGILETVSQASEILVIDGCPMACARHTMEQAGFTNFIHLRLWELGFVKGSSPVTSEAIDKVVASGRAQLGSSTVMLDTQESSPMEIKILGTGCPKCKRLEQTARKAAEDAGLTATFIKVSDINDIMTYPIANTPALVLNGEVKCSGRLPSAEEITGWLKAAV
jgi:small redox-active disulfide protein 2